MKKNKKTTKALFESASFMALTLAVGFAATVIHAEPEESAAERGKTI